VGIRLGNRMGIGMGITLEFRMGIRMGIRTRIIMGIHWELEWELDWELNQECNGIFFANAVPFRSHLCSFRALGRSVMKWGAEPYAQVKRRATKSREKAAATTSGRAPS
jgi:hypothetical protein